jgi:cytochrome c-type biogenesis protein CcmH
MDLFFLTVLLMLAGGGESGRVATLENALLAPCCYQEPVARHGSETAATMRAEIRRMVAEGRTDREILDHYIGRYGKRVLVEPEGAARQVMNAIPVAAAAFGLAVVVLLIRRWRQGRGADGPAGAEPASLR